MCIETIQFTISKELQYDVISLSWSVCNTISMLSSIIPVKSWYEKSSSYASAIENELQMNLLDIKSIIIKSWCSQKELGSDFCFCGRGRLGEDNSHGRYERIEEARKIKKRGEQFSRLSHVTQWRLPHHHL